MFAAFAEKRIAPRSGVPIVRLQRGRKRAGGPSQLIFQFRGRVSRRHDRHAQGRFFIDIAIDQEKNLSPLMEHRLFADPLVVGAFIDKALPNRIDKNAAHQAGRGQDRAGIGNRPHIDRCASRGGSQLDSVAIVMGVSG